MGSEVSEKIQLKLDNYRELNIFFDAKLQNVTPFLLKIYSFIIKNDTFIFLYIKLYVHSIQAIAHIFSRVSRKIIILEKKKSKHGRGITVIELFI